MRTPVARLVVLALAMLAIATAACGRIAFEEGAATTSDAGSLGVDAGALDAFVPPTDAALPDARGAPDAAVSMDAGDSPTDASEPTPDAGIAPDAGACTEASGATRVQFDSFDIVGGDSRAVLIWVAAPANTLDLAFIDDELTFSGPRRIAGTVTPRQPRLVRTTSGYFAAWTDGPVQQIFFQRFDASLAPIDAPQPLRTTAQPDRSPHLAASGDDIVITWLSEPRTPGALWTTMVSATDVIAPPVQLAADVAEHSVSAGGPGTWGILYFDTNPAAPNQIFVTYNATTGLGAPVITSAIPFTSSLLWTEASFLSTGMFGGDGYAEVYTSAGARTTRVNHTITAGTTGGTADPGELRAAAGAYVHAVCMPRVGGGSVVVPIWYRADATPARIDGPAFPIPDPSCAHPLAVELGATVLLAWADPRVVDHSLELRTICP